MGQTVRFNKETGERVKRAYDAFHEEMVAQHEALDGSAIEEFRTTILANELPSIELTDRMIKTAMDLGEYIARKEIVTRLNEALTGESADPETIP